jgi:hypothetical protein
VRRVHEREKETVAANLTKGREMIHYRKQICLDDKPQSSAIKLSSFCETSGYLYLEATHSLAHYRCYPFATGNVAARELEGGDVRGPRDIADFGRGTVC